MKRLVVLLGIFLSTSLVFNSCTKDDDFDQALLVGKWQSGTVFFKYTSDGNGVTWDTADDVTEAEGQIFTWTLKKAELTQIHIMSVGGNVPKVYTVTELTATSLKYHDSFNVSYSFTKVN